ncbi:MAG: hypothetical protein Fur0046_08570 [Cyanobacteria bacterium J069]
MEGWILRPVTPSLPLPAMNRRNNRVESPSGAIVPSFQPDPEFCAGVAADAIARYGIMGTPPAFPITIALEPDPWFAGVAYLTQ